VRAPSMFDRRIDNIDERLRVPIPVPVRLVALQPVASRHCSSAVSVSAAAAFEVH